MTCGRRHPSEYTVITAEVYFDASSRKNKVRPTAGEQFPPTMNIECAREIRRYPLGTRVRLRVVDTDREGGKPFLYSSYKWAHEIVGKRDLCRA